jgi:hypothetical protein
MKRRHWACKYRKYLSKKWAYLNLKILLSETIS